MPSFVLRSSAFCVIFLALTGCAPASLSPLASPAPATDRASVVQPTSQQADEPESAPSSETATRPSSETSPSPLPSTSSVQTTASATPTVRVTAKPLLSEGDESAEVRELQHRLLQLNWFEGEITATYGPATRLAVEGFQTKRALPATGQVDQDTWDLLVGMTRRPTQDEMNNVQRPGPALYQLGNEGKEVRDLQARLKQLDWFEQDIDGKYAASTVNAVSGFQERREIPVTGRVDQTTLDRLESMTRTPTTDELNNVLPKVNAAPTISLDDQCLTGRVICISKQQNKLSWVIDGQVQFSMDVRFGSELTPTRNGVFAVNWKSRHHVSTIYGSKMPYALFFSGGQAVHYSSDFAERGYAGASHGCVNVRDEAAVSRLFDLAREGDKVVVYPG